MLSQSEMDKAVMEAKKSLSDEQIKDAIKRCSYGGPMVHAGGFIAKEDIPKVNDGPCFFSGFNQIKPLDCQGINMKGGDNFGKTNA